MKLHKFLPTLCLIVACATYLIYKNFKPAPTHEPASADFASELAASTKAPRPGEAVGSIQRASRQALASLNEQISRSEARIGELAQALRTERQKHDSLSSTADRIKIVLREFPETESADVASLKTSSSAAAASAPMKGLKTKPGSANADIISPVSPELAGLDKTQAPVTRDAATAVTADKAPGTTTAPRAEEPKDIQSLVGATNASLNFPIAKVDDSNAKKVHFRIDGGAMLLTDRNRPRVSHEQIVRLRPLINDLSTHHLESVVIRASENVPERHIQALLKFVRQQYGWKATVNKEPNAVLTAHQADLISNASEQIFPLQIDIISLR